MGMNFKPLKYILRSSAQRFAAIHTIDNLPLEEDHPLEVLIRKYVKQRTLSQNGYYWMRLGEVENQVWSEGRQYIDKAWHELFAEKLMPEEITTKKGEVRSKWFDKPGGGRTVISTADLDVKSMAEYTTIVEAHCVTELGVQFKANGNERNTERF